MVESRASLLRHPHRALRSRSYRPAAVMMCWYVPDDQARFAHDPASVVRSSSWLLEGLVMKDPYARVIALAALLVGLSTLILSPSVRAQQPVSELPVDEFRARAEQGEEGAIGS